MYCISNKITGLEKDLIFNKDLKLINREKIESDIVICKTNNPNSISYFSKNADVNLELDIPLKYRNMWGFIKRNPDWSKVLGVEKFVKMCNLLLRQTKAFNENSKNNYYTKISPSHYELFKEIK